jgi:hypothetical protein
VAVGKEPAELGGDHRIEAASTVRPSKVAGCEGTRLRTSGLARLAVTAAS